MSTFLPLLVSMLVAWGMINLLLRGRFLGGVIDLPNERSLHVRPVPRTGGIGLMAGILAGWVFAWQSWMLPLAIGGAALLLLSFLDDLRGLSAGGRFFIHLMIAGMFAWSVSSPNLGWIWLGIVTFVIVWMTNLYNFMDGSDGLAGGMAVSGFSSYGVAAWLAGDVSVSVVCFVLVTSALAFLKFNFNPARIFMGDSGSIPLGFFSAGIGLLGWQRELWPIWFPMMVFSPFVVDATVTLTRRLLRGEKVWQAHREHFYQQLVQMGWGHCRTALSEYVLMGSVGLTSILMLNRPWLWQAAFGALWMLAYLLAMILIHQQWHRFQFDRHEKT